MFTSTITMIRLQSYHLIKIYAALTLFCFLGCRLTEPASCSPHTRSPLAPRVTTRQRICSRRGRERATATFSTSSRELGSTAAPQGYKHYHIFHTNPAPVITVIISALYMLETEELVNSWTFPTSLGNAVYLQVLEYQGFYSWCTTRPDLGMCKTETSRSLKEKAYKPFLNPWARTRLWHTLIALCLHS